MNHYKKLLLLTIMILVNSLTAQNIILENDDLRLEFGDASRGFGCLGITDKQSNQTFVTPGDNWSGLWRIDLTGVNDKKDDLSIDNGNAAEKSYRKFNDKDMQILEFKWKNLKLLNPQDSLDVVCTIKLPKKTGPASWNLKPTLKSNNQTFNNVVFPLLSKVSEKGVDDLLFPSGTFGAQLFKENKNERWTRYPSCVGQVQFLGVFRNNGGLYLGIHDATASSKDIFFNGNLDLFVMTGAENIGVANKSKAVDYNFVIAPAKTPWEAGREYKKWATKQTWTSKGLLENRHDIPEQFKNVDLWLNVSGDPADIENKVLDVASKIGGTLAIHWYNWNVHKFDTNYPEYFPAKNGFVDTVKKITSAGHLVMPYINGHLWDTTIPSYQTLGKNAATLDRAGHVELEDYNSGVKLAPMCPGSQIIQNEIAKVCNELVAMGVNGIYFDQIAAMAPSPCFNKEHGHELGLGSWWVKSYRDMLSPVLTSFNGKVFFATENAAEPYMDHINAFLTWIEVRPTDFPALMQTYSGYATYFCLLSVERDDYKSFTALQSRSLLWNIEPGWMAWLFDDTKQVEDHAKKQDFIRQIIQLRKAMRPYYSDGALLDELKITSANPQVAIEWWRVEPSEKFEMNAVNGTIWYSNSNKDIAIALSNVADQTLPVEFTINLKDYDLPPYDAKLIEVNHEGKEQSFGEIKLDKKNIRTTLKPYEQKVIIIKRK